MANNRAIRWRVDFSSPKASCRVDIYKTYTGQSCPWSDIVYLTGADNPFEYQEADSTNLLDFIRYKTGYIRIWEKRGQDWSDIYPSSIQDRYVKAYYGGECVFTGYIQCQDFNQEWVEKPRVLEFPVISPMGLLESLYFTPPATPGLVTLGSLMQQAVALLDAAYDTVVSPNYDNWTSFSPKGAPWTCRMFSTVCTPFNSSFRHYNSRSELYSPESLLFFFEGVCAWLGLTLHDTPRQILFIPHRTAVSLWSIAISDMTGSASPVNRPTIAFGDAFSPSSNDHIQNTRPPLRSLSIRCDGEEAQDELTARRSVLVSSTTPSSSTLYAENIRLENISPDVQASTSPITSATIPDGAFPIGPMMLSNGTIASSSTQARWMVRYKKSLSLILSKTFSSMTYAADSFCIRLKMGRGSSIDTIQQTGFEDFSIGVRVEQNGKYWNGTRIAANNDISNAWSDSPVTVTTTINGETGEPLLLFNEYALIPRQSVVNTSSGISDPEFQPVTVTLVPIQSSSLQDGEMVEITELSISDTNSDKLADYRETHYRTEIKREGPDSGIGDATVNLHFHNDMTMLNSYAIGTGGRIAMPDWTIYNYMFSPQRFLTVTVESSILNAYRHICTLDGASYEVVSDSFKLCDDEHRIVLARF